MQIKYAQSKSFELKYTKAIYVLFGSWYKEWQKFIFSILEVYNKQRNDDAILNSAMADEERIKQQHYLSEEKVTAYIDLCLIIGQSNI